MRIAVPVALIVLSALSFLVGIGSQEIWPQPTTITEQVDVNSEADELVVLDGSVADDRPGDMSVRVQGEGRLDVAIAPTSDVAAWVGDTRHVAVTPAQGGEDDEEARPAVAQQGSAAGHPQVLGSDLWVAEQSGEDRVTVRSQVTPGSSVLVSGRDADSRVSAIELSWPNTEQVNLMVPLFITGYVFLALGLLVIVLQLIGNRRGPRRRSHRRASGAAGRGSGRRSGARAFVVIPLVLALATAVGGCTATPSPDEETSVSVSGEPPAELQPPVSEAHFQSILSRVQKTAAEADQKRDAKLLSQRFEGQALESRRAQYQLQGKSKEAARPSAFRAEPLQVFLPSQGTDFPRTVFAAVEEENSTESPTLAILRQDSPRDNYKVVSVVDSRLPGVAFPDVPSAELGSATVPAQANDLSIRPADIVEQYGEAIDSGDSTSKAFDLSKDEFVTGTRKEADEQRKRLGDVGQLRISRTEGASTPVGMRTQSGGAVVAVSMNERWRITPRESTGRITLDGLSKSVLGMDRSQKGIELDYGTTLLFSVPKRGEGAAQLIGYAQAATGVKELE